MPGLWASFSRLSYTLGHSAFRPAAAVISAGVAAEHPRRWRCLAVRPAWDSLAATQTSPMLIWLNKYRHSSLLFIVAAQRPLGQAEQRAAPRDPAPAVTGHHHRPRDRRRVFTR
jgi:hypothetical protein